MGGQRPHVEIAAVIPDGQGKIVIGKRKGKTGTGKFSIQSNTFTPVQDILRSSHNWKRDPDICPINRAL